MKIDPMEFRATMGCYATGIAVITTIGDQDEPVGVTVNSFTSVSLDPPLVLFCLDRNATSLAAFDARGKFDVNVLAEDQQSVSARFAAPVDDRWQGFGWHPGPVTGMPLFDGCLASMECVLHAVHEGGDHQIIVGEVKEVRPTRQGKPLLYFRGRYDRCA